ncbi:pyridoxamine 5'-phosphate oxidase family protein [Angustibacter luteus]|uniref:Pyridoxamine 5'-phosphate oxidase family protein n=1 Tax=Angustibacter luteus TaxID=658456 RepID=A0ABW1JI05_9ACTN
MTAEAHAKVQELVEDVRTCMLSTVDDHGVIVSRPMTTQEAEFDGVLWFVVAANTPAVQQIRARSQVNVAYAGSSSWVSVSGTAEVLEDRAKIRELWNPVVGAWFPEGPDDADVALIRVDADTAEYWDSPGGRVATVLSLVKAKVTGEPYDGGENETVEL